MIPVFDYLRGYQQIQGEVEAALRRVIASGQLILGPEGEAFEREFAAYAGARQAVAVASGTDAIVIALRALGIGRGDEVITVSHTAAATVGAVREVGAVPRLVDVDRDSLLIDPDQIEAHIGPRTRAILPVHLYGRPAAIDAIGAIAARHGLAVVEDCAQAHGARVAGRHVGTFGAIGCFSFYPTKNLGALGDGGLCVTDDSQLAERMRQLRFHGFDARRVSQLEGRNSRLDEIQAAILRVKLRHLETGLSARRRIAGEYLQGLSDARLSLPECEPDTNHAWHLFVVRTRQRARLIEHLTRSQIGYGIHYPVPIHLMPAYSHLGYARGSLPVTEYAAEEILSLPMFPELAADEVRAVCRAVLDALRDE
ncbi:MAG: DegT/DnrJ/EryC1/StrS family aminotransferase [Planctomycetaceae bacterium]|nr:DegT/DnrJ/EryC1/StrS family aminotransferase [Planctomycetaceae bacterium]